MQGLKITKSFTIKEPQAIVLKHHILNPSIAGQATGSIELQLEGGFLNTIIPGQMDNQVILYKNLIAGIYSCNVVDTNNCQKSFGPLKLKNLLNFDDGLIKEFKVEPNPVSELLSFMLL